MRVIKIIFVVFVLFTTICATAQTNTKQEKDVTTFLGIPVDGTKNEMIQKLKNKGFTYDAKSDILKGEFNGKDVKISVVTNNGKVYRIVVDDANYTDEADIKIRFNNLCYQFKNNSKYWCPTDFTIPEDEDISYEMMVHNKIYQAAVTQVSKEYIFDFGVKIGTGEYTEIKKDDIVTKIVDTKTGKELPSIQEQILNKMVWFTITKFYGTYGITIYYDNGYNKANGEDL